MRFPFSGDRRFLAACLLFLCLAAPLSAYTPIYSVRRQVTANDVHLGVGGQMILTGFDGRYLSGYLSYKSKVQNIDVTRTEAFIQDFQSAAAPLNLQGTLDASSSLTTCAAAPGVVGGLFWSNSDGAQYGFLWQNGAAHPIAGPNGEEVDTITAVADGLAVGTYLGPYGLKRAFL